MTAEKWYYSIRGSVMGPVTTEQVRKLISAGLLNDGARVRAASGAEWQRPDEIQTLQVPVKHADTVRSASQDALRELVAKQNHGLRRQTNTASVTRSRFPDIRPAVSAAFEWLLQTISLIFFAPLSGIGSVSRRAIVWGTVSIIVTAAAIWIYHEWTWRDRTLRQIQQVWHGYTQLRDADVSADVWDQFRLTALPELNKLAAAAERRARGGDQNARDLMRMTRDVLPSLIRSAPNRLPGLESQYDLFVTRIARNDVKEARGSLTTIQPSTWLLLLFDGLLATGAATWVIRQLIHVKQRF